MPSDKSISYIKGKQNFNYLVMFIMSAFPLKGLQNLPEISRWLREKKKMERHEKLEQWLEAETDVEWTRAKPASEQGEEQQPHGAVAEWLKSQNFTWVWVPVSGYSQVGWGKREEPPPTIVSHFRTSRVSVPGWRVAGQYKSEVPWLRDRDIGHINICFGFCG